MKKPHISINQFAEFSAATEKRKQAIIKNQLKPVKFLVPAYASAKGSIRQYLKNVNDLSPIYEGLKKQLAREATTKWQAQDKRVSIEALQKFIELKIAKLFKGIKYEVVKPEIKLITMSDVDISISPEIIVRIFIDDKVIYGGVKVHISKTKPFTLKQCSYSATLLIEYIKNNIALKKEIVDPKLCFSVDVFSGRVVPASEQYIDQLKEIKSLLTQVKQIWEKVA
jgi:hypothetical protein